MEPTTNYNNSSPANNPYPQQAGSTSNTGSISSGPAGNNIFIPQSQSGYSALPQYSYNSAQNATGSGMMQNMTSSGNSQGIESSTSANPSVPSTSVLPYSPFSSTGQRIEYQTPAQSGIRTVQPLNIPILNNENDPETLTNPIYIPGFLRQNIGRWMRVEFLIGNTLTDRVGVLTEVGASYILLHSIDPNSYILCDMFSIKFVVIINTDNYGSLFIDQ